MLFWAELLRTDRKYGSFFFKGVKGFEYNRYAIFPDVAPKHYCGRALKSLYVTGLLSNLHSCYILYDKGWEPRPKSCLRKTFYFQAYARIRTLKITIIGKKKYNKQNMVVYLQTQRDLYPSTTTLPHKLAASPLLTQRFILVIWWLLPQNELMYVQASKANAATNNDRENKCLCLDSKQMVVCHWTTSSVQTLRPPSWVSSSFEFLPMFFLTGIQM